MNDLCRKALRRLPSFFISLRRREPSIKWLDLPDDVIYEISTHLDVRSLCSLSVTCRHLYMSLLFPHLRRLGFNEPFDEIHLRGENSSDALPALRLLRFANPIKTLSWRAGKDHCNLVREAEQLRRLIARIPSIEYLELDFSNDWPAAEARYCHENSYWAWIRVCTNLLHVVAQKCHFVVITNHYQALSPWLTFIGGKPQNLDGALLAKIRADWRAETKKVRLRSPSKISLSSPHTTQTHWQAFAPPFPPVVAMPGYATARLIINDPGFFQRSLFGEWAVKWVNMMPLTHLVINQGRMRLPLLRQLRLADLRHLTLSRGYGITATDVVQMLYQNPSLATLECLNTKLECEMGMIMVKSRKEECTMASIGRSLEGARGTCAFLARMLDLELAFLHLTTLTVQLRDDSGHEQRSLGKLLRAVSRRPSINTLVFDLPPRRESRHTRGFQLSYWLAAASDVEDIGIAAASETIPLPNLQHITRISFQNSHGIIIEHPTSSAHQGRRERQEFGASSPHHDSAALPRLLVKWLCRFTKLQEVEVGHIFDLPQDRRLMEVRNGLRRVFPSILVV